MEDVNVTVAAKEGIPTKPTLSDGTVTFEIPKQHLGQVNVTAEKAGYKRQELPLIFAINPNEIPKIDLEEDTSSPNTGGISSSPKIDWGTLKHYFDIDDDVNIVPGNGDLIVTVHVTAKKDFIPILFRAQPYDAYGVKTPFTEVSFSYKPPVKWKTGDRSLVTIHAPLNFPKLEIF